MVGAGETGCVRQLDLGPQGWNLQVSRMRGNPRLVGLRRRESFAQDQHWGGRRMLAHGAQQVCPQFLLGRGEL